MKSSILTFRFCCSPDVSSRGAVRTPRTCSISRANLRATELKGCTALRTSIFDHSLLDSGTPVVVPANSSSIVLRRTSAKQHEASVTHVVAASCRGQTWCRKSSISMGHSSFAFSSWTRNNRVFEQDLRYSETSSRISSTVARRYSTIDVESRRSGIVNPHRDGASAISTGSGDQTLSATVFAP